MRNIKVNYDEKSWEGFQTDIQCYKEVLSMTLNTMNNSVDSVLKKENLSKQEINEWINALQSWMNRAKLWVELPNRIKNNVDIELTDIEYFEFIRMLVHQIESSKARLEDFKSGKFSWGEQMIPHETEGLNRKIALYEQLEGKKYKYSDEMFKSYSVI